jgi:hypothetical protein
MVPDPGPISDCVERGATLLDSVRPGWADEVDVPLLRMSACPRCLLGQLYGQYERALRILGLSYLDAIWFGFNIAFGRYEILTDAWRAAILARRLQAPKSPEAPPPARPYTRPGWLARRWHEPEPETNDESPNHSPGEC